MLCGESLKAIVANMMLHRDIDWRWRERMTFSMFPMGI